MNEAKMKIFDKLDQDIRVVQLACCCKSKSPEGSCCFLCSKFRPANFHATGTSRQERKEEEVKTFGPRLIYNNKIPFISKQKTSENESNHQVILWKIKPTEGNQEEQTFFRNPDQNERNPNQREKGYKDQESRAYGATGNLTQNTPTSSSALATRKRRRHEEKKSSNKLDQDVRFVATVEEHTKQIHYRILDPSEHTPSHTLKAERDSRCPYDARARESVSWSWRGEEVVRARLLGTWREGLVFIEGLGREEGTRGRKWQFCHYEN
jgi:hypothetical protein